MLDLRNFSVYGHWVWSDYMTRFPTDLGYGKPGREREEDSGSDYTTCATGSGIQIRVRHTTLSFVCHSCLYKH